MQLDHGSVKADQENSVLMEYARVNLHYYRQKGTDLPHPILSYYRVHDTCCSQHTPFYDCADGELRRAIDQEEKEQMRPLTERE